MQMNFGRAKMEFHTEVISYINVRILKLPETYMFRVLSIFILKKSHGY